MIIEQMVQNISQQFEKADLFYGHGTDNPWDEACYLVLSIMDLPPDADQSVGKFNIPEDKIKFIQNMANKRIITRKPLAYLLEKAWFCGLPFKVTESVLIPRSPISELIQNQFMPYLDPSKINTILDLCTGSGCIALSCAVELPWVNVTGSDISKEALKIAQENTENLKNQININTSSQIEWVESDGFKNINKNNKFDLIVTNPPYVDKKEMDALPKEYLHEPKLGLESGVDGLDLTHHILKYAPDYLNPNGFLICEVGASWPALEAAYPNIQWDWIEFECDAEGVFIISREKLLKMGLQSKNL